MSFRYRLLFVGVNAVPDGPSLHAAARDAEAMSGRFACWGYASRTRHRLLVHQDATRDHVLDEIQSAAGAPGLDLLLIYWAGHLVPGARKHILTTSDHAADGSGGGVGLDVVTGAIAGAKGVGHRVLILDACNAAAAATHLSGMARQVEASENLAIFAAGGSDRDGRECPRRGYFTGGLLEQLPCDSRGLPPQFDLIQALRAGADRLPPRRREQPLVVVSGGDQPLCLPAVGRTLPFARKARSPRAATRVLPAPGEREQVRQRA
jgi:Caspase domain